MDSGKFKCVIDMNVRDDLTTFFKKHSYLKASVVAKLAGLNQSLVRQYMNGTKTPSSKQVKKIEEVIHKISQELKTVKLSSCGI